MYQLLVTDVAYGSTPGGGHFPGRPTPYIAHQGLTFEYRKEADEALELLQKGAKEFGDGIRRTVEKLYR